MVSLSCATQEQLGFDRRITLLDDTSFLYEFPPTSQKTDAASKEYTGTTTSPAVEGDETSTVVDAAAESAAADVPTTAEGDDAPDSELKPIYYKTTGQLSEFRAYRVAGRTTRIFKGKQVVSKEDPTPLPDAEDVVVKDIWIGADSPTELEIQQRLFKDIEDLRIQHPNGLATHVLLGYFGEQEARELDSWLWDDRYKDLFLCVDSESVGQGNKAVHPKAWDSDDIFVPEQPTPGESYAGTGDRTAFSIPPTVAPPSQTPLGPTYTAQIPSSRRGFSPKKRCFYIFKQVCTRVSDLATLGDAIGVIRHAYLGELYCPQHTELFFLTLLYQPSCLCSAQDGSTETLAMEIFWRRQRMVASLGKVDCLTWSMRGSSHQKMLVAQIRRL